jgi:peptidoglycan/LPS O-acetylase OafA/YrhL
VRSLNIKYIAELDQLRGIAALLVLVFHSMASKGVAAQYLGVTPAGVPLTDSLTKLVIANGFTGVALFFVISGFLFTWGGLQVDRFDWRKFYTNRVLRIYPLYVLVLLAVVCLGYGQIDLGGFVQRLVGFGNLMPGHNDFDIVLWTISVELQFYMLFPFLLGLLKRKGIWYLAGLVAILVAVRLIARLDHISLHDPVYWTLLGRLDQFLVGMGLAWLVHRRGWLKATDEAPSPRRFPTWALAGLAIGFTVELVGLFSLYTNLGWKYGESYFLVVWPLLEAVTWAGIGIGYVGLARRFKPWWLGAVQFVGMISYSLYLLHYPIMKAVHAARLDIVIAGHPMASGWATTLLVILPASLALALLTYYVVEKPPLDWRQQYATFKPADGAGRPKANRRRQRRPAVPTVSGSDA